MWDVRAFIFTRVPDDIFYKDTEPFAQLAIIYAGEMLIPVSHSCGIFFPKSLFACVIGLLALLVAVVAEILSRRKEDDMAEMIIMDESTKSIDDFLVFSPELVLVPKY